MLLQKNDTRVKYDLERQIPDRVYDGFPDGSY